MVQNKRELEQFLRDHTGEIRAFGVDRLGVFGSFVRGDQTAGSDIDFMVQFKPGEKTWDNFINLAYFLEDRVGRRIELLTPESLAEHVRGKILAQVEYVQLAA